MSDWSKYKSRGDERTDEDIAHEVADRVTKTVAIEPKRETNLGDKRRAVSGKEVRPPLNGCTQMHSDVIRHVVGLKYAGYTKREAYRSASDKYDMKQDSVASLLVRKQEATELADYEHLERCLQSYNSNLWLVRTALSEAGPRAVKTLLEVMDDHKSTPATRMKAAVAILKMTDVDGSANANPSEKTAIEHLKLIKEMRESLKKENAGHIVDAEDAEVIEEGVQ